MITRLSSRQNPTLAKSFFKKALQCARSYDRIAGYFSSSLLEIAGEEIEAMEGVVRIVCNSQLQAQDVKFIKSSPKALKDEWCEANDPEELATKAPERLQRLYHLLASGKLLVRVVPSDVFGLIHGKAGVITYPDGRQVAFLGSMNETWGGWAGNYELVWTDDDPEAITWVQAEFDHLWHHPSARELTEFIIQDIERISVRKVIYDIKEWRKKEEPAATVIESPVYRKEFGLWEHQKYFVNLAWQAHRKEGARYVLADMVGLGKTIQLAMAAQLMALEGDKPILVIAPKTLIWQWQEELMGLLDMPSAIWDGKQWIDENKIVHPVRDASFVKKCPRRIGILSQGLIVAQNEIVQHLVTLQYECVIVDEAHRARRRNLGKGKENEHPDPNNLMGFLLQLAPRTKSLLLATATPVQINPIEAWDMLYILSQGNWFVLGDAYSNWQREKARSLKLITGKEVLENETAYWDWIRNPLPPATENQQFGVLRRVLNVKDTEHIYKNEAYSMLNPMQQSLIRSLIADDFLQNHNPYIRYIVRRTRDFLEKEGYLKPIHVNLFGENDDDALELRSYLRQAYELAREFSELLQKRARSGGFIKTLLLRRIGSTMNAGRNTALKMLNEWGGDFYEEDDEYESEEQEDFISHASPELKDLTRQERDKLEDIVRILDEHKDTDPKYRLLLDLLTTPKIEERWLDRGCIVFSQYYDSISFIAEKLTKDLPKEVFGVYAGNNRSGIYENGIFKRKTKEEIKKMVKTRQIRLLFGTEAASEGLNLQTLGTLINLDLPWNPTKLEQRKGRIQRIGQEREEVLIYNMRYKDSVEDIVHKKLSDRLKQINDLFGQLPDTLEDVWIQVALNQIEEAEKKIKAIPTSHPFSVRYQENVQPINWETCEYVLDKYEKREVLMKGW